MNASRLVDATVDSRLIAVAAQALEEGRPYVLATVIRRERPSSASPGDAAVITADGQVHGWIGGSCTQPEVVRQALDALREGKPRLLSFGISREPADGFVNVPMTCGSEGKVEVHVSPVFPPPNLLVVGASPVAQAVGRLGDAMGWRVVATDAEPRGDLVRKQAARPQGSLLYAVVATMGRADEQALAAALKANPDYVGVVASPKRMAQIRTTLTEGGTDPKDVDRVSGPAGIDIGARRPEEVAVSILAEVVQSASRESPGWLDPDQRSGAARPCAATVATPSTATDPVCGMAVAPEAAPSTTFDGKSYYFCCEGCRRSFDSSPQSYMEES